MAAAVDYAHRQGVIHRDLKSSNVVVDDEGQPHLLDFGLAKRQADETTLTVDGQLLGTPAYMSPEQALGRHDRVGPRSDVYSLGVILYELLTGELPFRGHGRMVLWQVIDEDPRPPRRLDGRIPRDLETICLKAMAKEPARRYDSAAALADDLRRFLRGDPVVARPRGRAVRLWRRARRRPVVSGLLAVLALAVLLGAAGVAWQWHRAEAQAAEADRQRLQAKEMFRHANETILSFTLMGRQSRRLQGDEGQPFRAGLMEAGLRILPGVRGRARRTTPRFDPSWRRPIWASPR